MYGMLRYPNFLRKAVTLSYDDGVDSDKRLIQLLDKYGLKCTFNINSGMYGFGTRFTCQQAKELYGSGNHEVAVHGYKHLSLTEVPVDVAIRDVALDRENLEKTYGRIVKGMAYANGAFDDTAVDVVKKCGIAYARTVNSTRRFDLPTDWLRLDPTCHHADPQLMSLVDAFLDCEEHPYFWANTPRLFYLWGHSFEFRSQQDWDVIESFAQKVGNRDDVWYATNGEIYDYVKAYDSLQYSIDGTVVYNPTVTDVYLYYYGKELLVKGGEKVVVQL